MANGARLPGIRVDELMDSQIEEINRRLMKSQIEKIDRRLIIIYEEMRTRGPDKA